MRPRRRRALGRGPHSSDEGQGLEVSQVRLKLDDFVWIHVRSLSVSVSNGQAKLTDKLLELIFFHAGEACS